MTSTGLAARPAELGNPFSWRFTTPLYIGSALNPVNTSMIATALVPIATGLHVSIGQTASLVTALYVASAIAQPTAGKVASIVGARRVFVAGIILVLLGGLLGGFAPDLAVLLVARVLIGLGTSCAYPSAMMLIQRQAKVAGMEKPPGGVLGGLQIAGLATAALGLPVGGVLVQTLGWRSVFFVNVPVALLALAAALIWIPRDQKREHRQNATGFFSSIDLTGIIGFALFMSTLLLFLLSLSTPNWFVLGAAIVLFALLLGWELRAKTPFIDMRLLVRNRALTRSYVRYAMVAFCVYIIIYGLSQWLETVRGMPALSAGLLLLPMSVISGIVVVPISRRNLIRGPLVVAALATLVGSFGVILLTSGSSTILIVAITVLFGIALGAAASGNQLALYLQAPAEQLGVASGLFRTFGYFGSIGSSAVTGIIFNSRVASSGLHTIGFIMLGVSVVVVALTLLDRKLRTPAPTTAKP